MGGPCAFPPSEAGSASGKGAIHLRWGNGRHLLTEKKVVGSDGFDGLNDEGDSDYFGYKAGGGGGGVGPLAPCCTPTAATTNHLPLLFYLPV
jgi:hypothetical protein